MARTAPKILSIAPELPDRRRPYAGSTYYHEHIACLVDEYDVAVFAPDSPPHVVPVADPVDEAFTVLRGTRRGGFGPAVRVRDKLHRVCSVMSPGRHVVEATDALLSALRATPPDLVEVQWPEYQGLLPRIREALGPVPLVSVVHDVYTQRLERARDRRPSSPAELRDRLLPHDVVARTEAALLNRSDLVIVFSEKDERLLRDIGVTTRVEALAPPLCEDDVDYDEEYAPRADRPCVLFVGALDRDVNQDAVRWLMSEIWPDVVAACPSAELVLAGHSPPDDITARAWAARSVTVTGYVPDLAELYARAHVVVAPLRYGAGLKFKVATAMLWCRPVVTTEVGAEGYPADSAIFGRVSARAEDLAGEIVTLLTDRGHAAARALAGRRYAEAAFSAKTYRERLGQLYRDLVPR